MAAPAFPAGVGIFLKESNRQKTPDQVGGDGLLMGLGMTEEGEWDCPKILAYAGMT